MKQKIIISTEIYGFQIEVNQHLKEGWRIIPGTLSTSVASVQPLWGHPITSYVCSIALEMPAP